MRVLIYSVLALFHSIYLWFSSNSLRVLAYHTVPDREKFQKQISYLSSHFKVISLAQLENHIVMGQALPGNSVLITFDDGDVSVLKNGLPVLKQYKLPSVLFVISNLIDSSETFWPRWVEKNFNKGGKSYAEARKKINQLKKASNIEREKYLNTLEKIDSPQLTSVQLKKMEAEGVFIGNHTHTHPMIDKCSVGEIEFELDEVQKRFAQWSLEGYSVFAYPNGNWDERAEKILKERGIKLAFLFDHKVINGSVNPLRISRIMVDSDSHMNEFKTKVSGLHSKLLQIRNRLKGAFS